MKQKRKKKNGAEVNIMRSTRLTVDEADKANRMSLRRLIAWNCGMKCEKIWNDGSVNRMDLSESNHEIANGNCLRRSNGRNEKDLEIESGSWGVMGTVETKQIQWVDECDNWRDRGCIENVNEKVKVSEKRRA